jgi:hypothetical protein
MIQPLKADLRRWLSEARQELRSERDRRRSAEFKLKEASAYLGRLALADKIDVPAEKLGELVLKLEIARVAELESAT